MQLFCLSPFTQLEYAPPEGNPDGAPEPVWVESARWKNGLEEDVEYNDDGSERFGVAHASGATMHGFFAFHQCLKKCVFLFDLDAHSLEEIAVEIVQKLVQESRINEENASDLQAAITAHHHHAMSKERHDELMAREKRRREKREKMMGRLARRRSSWAQGMSILKDKLAGSITNSRVNSASNSLNNSAHGSRATSRSTSPRGSRQPSLDGKLTRKGQEEGEPLVLVAHFVGHFHYPHHPHQPTNLTALSTLFTRAVELSDMTSPEDAADALASSALKQLGIDDAPPAPPRRNSSFGKLASLIGGGERRGSTDKGKRQSFSMLPALDDSAAVVIDDDDAKLGWKDDKDEEDDQDDDAFDVMVGTCPFLDRQVAAFVRLGDADIIGELAEEGYRTRDLFLCLGPPDESEEVWQIGRSFAILMSQEEFAQKIDSATTKDGVISTVDYFIDQSVIIPNPHKSYPGKSDGGFNLGEAHSENGDSADGGESGVADIDADVTGDRRRSSAAQILSPEHIAALAKQHEEKSFFGKLLDTLGFSSATAPSVSSVLERSVEVPQHVLLQQRRRQRIAQERNRQLIKFAVEEEGCAKKDVWEDKDKRMLVLISTMCLALLLAMTVWVGPALKESHGGVHVHEVHMHGFAGEVGGMIGISRDASFKQWLVVDDEIAVFDIKAVVQRGRGDGAEHRRRRLEEDGHAERVSIDIWSSLESKSCVSTPDLVLGAHDEAELLETVFTDDDWDSSCTHLTKDNANLFYFNVSTTSETPIAMMFQADGLPPHAKHRTLLSALLLALVYFCIVTDIVHRTLVAMIGAALSLLLLATLNYHASMQTAIVWMDEGTLALLFGMMIIVNLVSTTGLFEWVAIRALGMSGGYMTKLMVLLCVATAFLSAFLDNVTTMLLLAPVTIELCKVIDMNPVAFLVSEVMFSNIGGTATMIGDPPNIIIGNMLSEYVGFVDFIVNLAPCILLSSVAPMFFLMWYYKSTFDVPRKEFDMELLKKKYRIVDSVLLAKSGVILGTVLLLFFLHPVHHVDTSWVACIGAVALMVVAIPHELHHVFESVEWDTLLFFAALFVMIEALATMGLIRSIGTGLSSIIAAAPAEMRLRVAICLILWVSAIVSGFLDNIPYTATMVPVVKLLSEDPALGLPLEPLVWALSLGACLGGNVTLVGASANLVTAGSAEHAGHKISFKSFMLVGTPVTFLSVCVATAYCILLYDVGGVGGD